MFGCESSRSRAALARMASTESLHAVAGAARAEVGNQHLYRRHRPEETSLYPLIETNLSAFLEHLRERDAPLPRFVVDEFKAYLRCGRPAAA